MPSWRAPIRNRRGSLPAAEVRTRQEKFYVNAEKDRFEWLTQHPFVRRAEERILRDVASWCRLGSLLEVGCGEGAALSTLRRMGARCAYTGFDCFPDKIRFCRDRHENALFLVGDAGMGFPLRTGLYDCVLIRDVLHHLAAPEREALLREAWRVLGPRGTLCIVEGNANNPVALVFALLFKHERCMLETRSNLLRGLVKRALRQGEVALRMEEPSTLFRFLFHYRMGFPAIGRRRSPAWMADRWGALMRRLLPPQFWAYSIVTVSKKAVP